MKQMKNLNGLPLSDLLFEVDRQFVHKPSKRKDALVTYDYSLGKFPNNWCFTVTNDWHQWLDKHLNIDFYGATPEAAVRNFLQYVIDNKINVHKLMYTKPQKRNKV
jgi:hypothetical protein